MEEPTLDALIDQYLLGTISSGDRTRLEKRMASDPAVARLVKDSKLAYKAVLLERNRVLKEKLKRLDKEDVQEQLFVPRKWSMVFFITILVVLTYTFLAWYNHPQRIALRNLADYPGQSMDAAPTGAKQDEWHLAKTAFLQNDFETAIQKYVVLAGDADTPGHYIARWNILMAQLAAEGPTSAWYLAMEAFASEAPEPLSSRSTALSGKFQSLYYNILFSPLKDKLSSLKPRLI